MKINDEGTSNAAHWHERAMKAEARLAEAERSLETAVGANAMWKRLHDEEQARLKKIMARCADLLDEDQFNELDAMTRTTVTVNADPTPAPQPQCACEYYWPGQGHHPDCPTRATNPTSVAPEAK